MIAATFDRSRLLPLYARIAEIGVPLILTFLDANGDPFSISGIDWKLNVKRKATDTSDVFELSLGDGLTVQGASDHQLKVELSVERSTQRNETHFYRLYDYEELHTWLNGPFRFHNGEFDGVEDTDTLTVTFDSTVVTIQITTDSGAVDLSAATQAEVDAGTVADKYVSPETLNNWSGSGSSSSIAIGTYSSVFTFDVNEEVYKDASGLDVSITLAASGNVNGILKILRIENPTSVTFDAIFERSSLSADFLSDELNICTFVYFSDYDGAGTKKVVYSNVNSLQAPIKSEAYSTELNFSKDAVVAPFDATGASPTFTLGTKNVDGVVKFLRLNKPNNISWPANFIADQSSVAVDSTKLNIICLQYFADWDGLGNAKVLYSNHTFTAL